MIPRGYVGIVSPDLDLLVRIDCDSGPFYEILDRCLLKFRNHSGPTREWVEGYGAGAGFLLVEFVVRRDVCLLLVAILLAIRGPPLRRVQR